MAKLLLGSVFVALSFFGTSLLLHNLSYRGGAFGIGIVAGLVESEAQWFAPSQVILKVVATASDSLDRKAAA